MNAPPPPPSFCPHGLNRTRTVCGVCVRELQRKNAALEGEGASSRTDCPHAVRDVVGPAILICRECGDTEVERLDVRQRALELAWKTRELLHSFATCQHPVIDPVTHRCMSCGTMLGEGPADVPALVKLAKMLDAELQSYAPRVAAEETP